jgi:hypothetical protein
MNRLSLTTTAAAIALLGAAFAPAIAEDRPVTKAPPKTMGDEGKLPATDTVTGKVPDMGSTTADPNTATPPRPDATAPKTMGDEGKLPATKSMGEQVPAMKP